jgi:hypothetical protein
VLPKLAPSLLEAIDLGQRAPQPIDRAVEGIPGFVPDELAIGDRSQHLQRVANVPRWPLSAVDSPPAVLKAAAILLHGYRLAAPVAQASVDSMAAV